MSVQTVFGLLLVGLQADFDLDCCNRHDLHTFTITNVLLVGFRKEKKKKGLPYAHGV